MNKRTLMLSAAALALLCGPALADTTINTSDTTSHKTSVDGNITINAGASITFKSATVPIVTIDSSNTVVNNGAIVGSGQDTATAVLIDTTAAALTGGFTSTGTIDLSGTGNSKTAIRLQGTNAFTGNISLSGTAMSVVGDNSTGILANVGTVVNGNILLGGAFAMTSATVNGAAPSGVAIAKLLGTIKGNVAVTAGSTYTAVGNGATGITIAGPLLACNTAINPACTETGTFINSGTIAVSGVATRSATGVNAESGAALTIGASIAGGVLNNGPTSANDTTNVAASISGNGTGASSAVVVIAPQVAATGITIGKNTADLVNPDFSFINRGSISAAPVDPNQSTRTILIAGQSDATVVFAGGFFNSGFISAQTSSTSNTSNGNSTVPGNPVTAIAMEIDSYVTIPVIRISGQSVTATGNSGIIGASIAGPQGGSAVGILIAGTAGTTSVPSIVIDSGARLLVNANVPDPSSTSVSSLAAIGIRDTSNSLAMLNNNGTISAVAQTLTNGVTSISRAVDTSANSIGLAFTNAGAVTGDVLFGSGNDTYLIQGTSNAVASHAGAINFGFSASGGGADTLHVAQFANVAGSITANGTLDVTIDGTGTLTVQNVGTTLATRSFTVGQGTTTQNSGTLNITVSQGTNVPVITATTATLGLNANLGIQYGSFVTAPSSFTLISTPTGGLNIDPSDIQRYNAQVGSSTTLPFLFASASIRKPVGGDGAGHDILQLSVVPKTVGTGVGQLDLTGYGKTLFSLANVAIVHDPALGAAMIAGVNSLEQAQAAYDSFAPDVSGGTRAIAISLTDQATGVVAARQRALRLFGKQSGDLTLWGNEFGEFISTKGSNVTQPVAGATAALEPGFKDHGFGFSLGIDEGGANSGWYGAAFTFYTGDVSEGGDRVSKVSTLWYLLTGYTDWRGKGLFFDSQLTVGYGNLKGKRFIELALPTPTPGGSTFIREADSKRAALLASLGFTFGANLRYGSLNVIPQLSVDGLTTREEGFTETGGGNGFDLSVKPYYANSLRIFLGSEFREDIDVGGFFLQPSVRLGYRYDLLNDPVKLRAAFADIDPNTSLNQPGAQFTLQGPDPSQGNYVAGLNLAATTENWTIGLNYDFVRGSNNETEQVGTISLLGRI